METTSVDPKLQLTQLGDEYRHVRDAHEQENAGGATRRRLEQDMHRIVERFERLLERWVHEDELRAAWRSYLYDGADLPDGPELAPPPLFRGRTDAGALIEIYVADDGGYDLLFDGAHVKHHEIPWHLDPELIDPVQIGEWSCHEIFAAPDRAIAALEEFFASDVPPPWSWVETLYEDGLIDADFGLTPRGARRLSRGKPRTSAGEGRNYCVIVADGGRARILTLTQTLPPRPGRLDRLQLVADVSNQENRARDSEQFANTRPGLRREGPHGPRHAVSDRRESHRREAVRQFAKLVVDEAARAWDQFETCRIVVVAPPQMLGLLRPVIAQELSGPSPHDVVELARDLTQLGVPAVHDALARAELVPERGRLPPMVPAGSQRQSP